MDNNDFIPIEDLNIKKTSTTPSFPVENRKPKQPEPVKLSDEAKDKQVKIINNDPNMKLNNLIMIDKSVLNRAYILIGILGLFIVASLFWFNYTFSEFSKKDGITNIPVTNNNQNNFTITNTPQSAVVNNNENNSYVIQVNVTFQNPTFRFYQNTT